MFHLQYQYCVRKEIVYIARSLILESKTPTFETSIQQVSLFENRIKA